MEFFQTAWRDGSSLNRGLTKYANATHLNEKELYIAEGGSRSKAQFLYNYESLDERSRKAVDRYFSKVQSVSKEYAGTMYAKSCTSKDFNFEIRKIKEENNHKKQILNSQRYGGVSY